MTAIVVSTVLSIAAITASAIWAQWRMAADIRVMARDRMTAAPTGPEPRTDAAVGR